VKSQKESHQKGKPNFPKAIEKDLKEMLREKQPPKKPEIKESMSNHSSKTVST